MNKEKLIEKAKRILEYFEINYEDREISIYKPTEIDPIYEKLGLGPVDLNTYTIFVRATEQIIPDVRTPTISLTVDSETDKVIDVITKHNWYKVPDELQ